MWEFYFHSFAGLAMETEGVLRQHVYLVSIFFVKCYIFPPVVAAVLDACHLCSHTHSHSHVPGLPLGPHHGWSLVPLATSSDSHFTGPIKSGHFSAPRVPGSLGLNASAATVSAPVCRLPRVRQRPTLRSAAPPVCPPGNQSLTPALSQVCPSAAFGKPPGLPAAAPHVGLGAGSGRGLYGPLLGAVPAPLYSAGSPEQQRELFQRVLWASAACGAYVGAVAVALGMGLVAGSYTVYEVLPALLPNAKVLRASLAQVNPGTQGLGLGLGLGPEHSGGTVPCSHPLRTAVASKQFRGGNSRGLFLLRPRKLLEVAAHHCASVQDALVACAREEEGGRRDVRSGVVTSLMESSWVVARASFEEEVSEGKSLSCRALAWALALWEPLLMCSGRSQVPFTAVPSDADADACRSFKCNTWKESTKCQRPTVSSASSVRCGCLPDTGISFVEYRVNNTVQYRLSARNELLGAHLWSPSRQRNLFAVLIMCLHKCDFLRLLWGQYSIIISCIIVFILYIVYNTPKTVHKLRLSSF